MRKLGLPRGFGKRQWASALPALTCVVFVGVVGCVASFRAGPGHEKRRPIKTTKMTLISNQENTLFRMRLLDEDNWTILGKGKILQDAEVPKNRPFEIAAKPDGYKEITHALVRPQMDLRFTFLLSHLEEHAERPPDPRRAERRRRESGTSVIRRRWAVVIGVSEYEDHRIPDLRYAADDAKDFHEWLTSANGGGYALAHTQLLINKQATFKAIREVLYEWLPQALEEDLVVIYFSGHGTPRSPDQPENRLRDLFLVPYDAEYDKIASSCLPMRDVRMALMGLKAGKQVVIADACHAGGVGAEFAGTPRAIGKAHAGRVTEGLQELSKVGDGVAVITSAGTNQLSRENKKWGGGHGVFTYFLLKGLKGEADYNENGRVTLGELILYLSEQVRQETKNAQSPEAAGKFDPALTLGK